MPVVRRFVSILCLAAAAVALGAPSAFAATPGTPYTLSAINTPFPQATGRFGERHAATDDINRDGVNDYFVGALSENIGATTNAGRVYAISGKTRAVLYTILSPEVQANGNFGFFISVLGDVDGDGRKDIAIGTDSQDVTAAGVSCTPGPGCNVNQGKAWVFSGGKGGALLYPVNNPDPQADGRFGSRIGRAGDIVKADGTPGTDGKPESIMGASNNDSPAGCAPVTPPPLPPAPAGCRRNQGQAYIFNGKDGTLVRRLNVPEPDQAPGASCSTACGTFGLSVQGPGDVDGDGVTDQLVAAGSLSVTAEGAVCSAGSAGCNTGQGRMYLFSGDDNGKLLARIDDPAPQADVNFGFQDAAPLAPGDVNKDGRADLFANGFTQAGPAGADAGRIWVFDGKATVDSSATKNGVVLYEPKDPTPTLGGQCCFSLDKTDYNKDGRPDLYVGQSPHHLPNPADTVDQSGGTYVFDGRDGAPLKSLELPANVGQRGVSGNLGSNLGWSVAAPGDLNRDGEPDYLAGATFQDMGANKDEGRAFVFLSNVPAKPNPPGGGGGGGGGGAGASKVINGTPGNDTLNGTPGSDVINCGAGNDVVNGGGGDDVINCGSGNDRVSGNEGNDRIDGGSGNDRLSGNEGNDRVLGGQGNDRANGNSGHDRVGGNSGNDRVGGQSGNDRVNGDSGRDRVSGGSGNDVVGGQAGNDRVNGDSGRDRVSGGSGKDVVSGSSGNDRLSGDSGNDRLSGGSGNDRLNGGRGRDRLNGGRGRDREKQ